MFVAMLGGNAPLVERAFQGSLNGKYIVELYVWLNELFNKNN